ncbi:malto-oligosyltrehalose trehalohydrolase [Candidatus Auribacterota bacterium]
MKIGADYSGDGKCEFKVWAPLLKQVALKIVVPDERHIPMGRDDKGYWHCSAEGVFPGTQYFYVLNGETERPDPASGYQSRGVHGPSQVVDHSIFDWSDKRWKTPALGKMIQYEVHVGAFTEEGTFDAVIPRIDDLIRFGIGAIEIMPVAQFPGERNWGYDGTFPFSVQNSYGGPEGLRRLVDACHKKGMAVILDVVYNHLGHEGNYLWDYGPYFTDKYRTPWGSAINFDGEFSNDVRNYFIENAICWFRDYHVDALRLDAVHGIFDMSAHPFLRQLARNVDDLSAGLGRKRCLIAESDLNDSKIITPREEGGFGIDAVWNDDFHHSVHTLLTGENKGYYKDFGSIGNLVKAIKEGFVYSGQYAEFRKRDHGNSSIDCQADQFVVFAQNHDQIGNRMFGERLSKLVSFEGLKLAAGIIMLSPNIPLLFMGEEYGEDNPFQYFVSFSDEKLINGVREGRKEEFKEFHWGGDVPDPQSVKTFMNSKLSWEKRDRGDHKLLLEFYKDLICMRKNIAPLAALSKDDLEVKGLEDKKTLFMRRWAREEEVFCVFNFSGERQNVAVPLDESVWARMMDSSGKKWKGPGEASPEKITHSDQLTVNPMSFIVYGKEFTS